MTAQPDNTIDGELEGLITNFIMQYDQRVKIGNKRNIEAVARHRAAITNLIAQEANKARLIELDLLEQAINQGRDMYEFKMARLKDLESRLTADKEQV